MGRHSTKIDASMQVSAPEPSHLKRKRDDNEDRHGKLEVDVDAPEPLSKKAMRKAKREGQNTRSVTVSVENESATTTNRETLHNAGDLKKPKEQELRTEFGIWIGNLPWNIDKPDLIDFFTRQDGIMHDAISRVHMPPPSKSARASNEHLAAARNKGFAYLDFTDQKAQDIALSLSNTFLSERRVLIKKSSDFEGRPESNPADRAPNATGHPPNRKVWIGNIAFEVTSEDLTTHFSQCGKVSGIQVATFPESGRCKGYAWLEFEALDAAEAAVRGYVMKIDSEEEGTRDDETVEPTLKSKKKQPRKWWVNKLFGRELQVQFAESNTSRYKKRFGSGQPSKDGQDSRADDSKQSLLQVKKEGDRNQKRRNQVRRMDSREKSNIVTISSPQRSLVQNFVEARGKKTILD